MAVVSGVIGYGVLLKTAGTGVALFISVPISVGSILGFGVRLRSTMMLLLSLIVIGAVLFGLASMNWIGVFCGIVLGFIFIPVVLSGVLAGWLLRMILMQSRWSQRWYLPIVLLAMVPYAAGLVESQFPRGTQVESVSTERMLDADPAAAWEGLMFYEEVRHDPPWLLHLALPKPIRSIGSKERVGDVVRCLYDRGELAKEITYRAEGERMAFRVTRQDFLTHDVKLRAGSFDFERAGPNRTRVTLTTEYERLLYPAALWRPIEKWVVHTLHGHVLEGMRRETEESLDGGRERYPGPAAPSPPIANVVQDE
jgi:hypothetical protein